MIVSCILQLAQELHTKDSLDERFLRQSKLNVASLLLNRQNDELDNIRGLNGLSKLLHTSSTTKPYITVTSWAWDETATQSANSTLFVSGFAC